MAGKRNEWDYALRIRGATPRGLSLSRLAEYLKAYASLLGDSNEPTFAGVVRGSALLRASVPHHRKLETKVRLITAKLDADEGLIRVVDSLAHMMSRDGFSGDIEDRQGAVILEFRRPTAAVELREQVIHDVGVIDGVVVGLVGIDDTVHVRLQSSDGQTSKVTVRDLAIARQLALHFRGDAIRAHVHGSWKRNSEGVWEPLALYLDRFDELSDEPAGEILSRLSSLPGNRWATMDDPDGLLRNIRSDD